MPVDVSVSHSNEQKAGERKKLPGIFISYRRTDTPDAVGRIYDRLVAEFGKARVFKDVDSIPLGQDFRSHLNDIVGGCAAVLAIVGPRWVDTRNATGQRRLEDPDDFVRIELEAALARNVPVVPVLVGHAPMPGSTELPASLASMAFRQSIEVRPDPDFHNDATRLVSALKVIIDPDAPPAPAPSASANVRTPVMRWIWPAAFAVAALAAAALVVPALRHLRQAPPPETRTEISTATQADTSAGGMAISPDGKYIVFVAMTGGVQRLWLRPLSSTTAQPLPGTEGGLLPFWAPDSRSIGFFTDSALKRLDLGGGTAMTLAPVAAGIGGSWNADDVILFSQGVGKPLGRIAATGGAVTEATPLEQGDILHLFPVFLPDGRRFVFASAGTQQGTYLGSLTGGAPVRLMPAFGEMAFLASGWLLIASNQQGVVFAQRLDVGKAALIGAPVTIVEGSGAISASATGLVAYWKRAFQEGERQLKWRSRTGGELGTIGAPDKTYFSPRVSPDGRRVVVTRGENGKQDLWLLDGERASRATFDSAGKGFPLWSPDGTRIVYASNQPGAPGTLFQKLADGAGEEELLLNANALAAPSSWSADGRHLMYLTLGQQGTLLDLWVLPMDGDRKPWAFLDSPFLEGGGEFSPDGRWVAYESDESTRREVYIRAFVVPGAEGATAARGGKWQVSTAGGTYPKWSPDGRELYFINPAGELMAAPITVTGAALTPGTPAKLFQMNVLGGGMDNQQGPQYDVARDGRFLINTVVDTTAGNIPPIILIQNWNPNAR